MVLVMPNPSRAALRFRLHVAGSLGFREYSPRLAEYI